MIGNLFGEIGSIIAEIFKKEEAWIFVFIIILGAGGVAVFTAPSPSFDFSKILGFIWSFIELTWWFWIFIILFPLAERTLLHWRQERFKAQMIKFVLLEIRIPREIKESPKAMEQVLASLHTLRNAAGDLREKYVDGEVTVWFALEMVSFGGEVRFYVRGQKKQRNLIEAAFFSYYPDLELEEVKEDYMNELPQSVPHLYETKKDIWSTEMLLVKEEAYPIKTYRTFEHMQEGKEFDPISVFLEVLGKVKHGEFVGMQFLIAPAGNEWRKRWEGLVNNLRREASGTFSLGESGEFDSSGRSPGLYDVLKAVEENLAKPAFDTIIRFLYIAPKETYYDSFARRGLVGAFNQYGSLDINSFIQNYVASTRTLFWYWPHILPKIRNEFKKQRILRNYLKRDVPPETWIGRLITSSVFNWNFSSKRVKLTTECLATLFHPPTAVVLTAPHMRRVESRKGGVPSGLPIYGKEEDEEKIKKLFS